MTRIVVITGYPGSGKTHLANTTYVPEGYALLDDIGLNPNLEQMLIQAFKAGKTVVTDPWLIGSKPRARFSRIVYRAGFDPRKDVTWIIFENDPQKAMANIERRNETLDVPRKISSLTPFTRIYSVPYMAKPLPIWQPEETS